MAKTTVESPSSTPSCDKAQSPPPRHPNPRHLESVSLPSKPPKIME